MDKSNLIRDWPVCANRVNRGNNGVSNLNTNNSDNTNDNNGWRPLYGIVQAVKVRLRLYQLVCAFNALKEANSFTDFGVNTSIRASALVSFFAR